MTAIGSLGTQSDGFEFLKLRTMGITIFFSGVWTGVFHANEADVVVKFPADGKRADDFGSTGSNICAAGFCSRFCTSSNQPFLGIQFLILPLYFVKAIR